MTTTAATVESAAGPHEGHHHELPWIRKYLFSTDHKVIAKQFMFTSFFFLLVGGLLATLMRWQLGFPGQPIPGGSSFPEAMAPGGIMLPELLTSETVMNALDKAAGG